MALKSFIEIRILCFACFLFTNVATAQKQDTAFQCKLAEEMPEFPGGRAALMKYIAANLKCPEKNDDWQSCSRIVVKFVITKSGKAEQIKLVRSCGFAPYEEAAIKLIQNMPQWKPGRLNGKVVDCDYILPISIHWSE